MQPFELDGSSPEWRGVGMIVRQFLQWVRTAPAAARADATGALARAYLFSDLSPDDRDAAEGALLMQLDDPSPLVRLAMAEALGNSPGPVAAAIAEVGCAESCLILIENPDAVLEHFSLDRIIERHGKLAAIREALLARDDLPVAARQQLVAMLAHTLARFVAGRRWIDEERAHEIARDSCEKATVGLAADAPAPDVRPLVRHLRRTGQLNAGLVLRALLSGNVVLFEEALADLADLPLHRVAGLVHDRGGQGLLPLFRRAGFPDAACPAAQAALEAMHEVGYSGEPGGAARLKRRMVERVLTQCEADRGIETEPLLMLLRRFALEAVREEARMFCDELAAA